MRLCSSQGNTGVQQGQSTARAASIVEVLCALALYWGAAAVLKQSPKVWRKAFIGNLIAVLGVLIGIIALAGGAGPRTLYHRIMLALAIAAVVILLLPAGRAVLRRN
jgi:Na+-transporting NADH:ubiquinone oxidoreductase subunit NqrB